METAYLNHVAHDPYCTVLDVFEEWEINRDLLKLEFYLKYPGEQYRQSLPTNSDYERIQLKVAEEAQVVEEFLLRVFEVE